MGQEQFDGPGQTYDVVIDAVGGEKLRRSFAVLRPGGRLVTLQAPPDADLAREPGVEAVFSVVGPDGETLAEVARLADQSNLHIEVAAAVIVVR